MELYQCDRCGINIANRTNRYNISSYNEDSKKDLKLHFCTSCFQEFKVWVKTGDE